MPELDLANSPRLQTLIRDGKLYISLHDAIALAIENNLDLASFRYNFPIARHPTTSALRPEACVQGVDTGIVQSSTQGGFSGGGGGGGSASSGSGAAGAGGLVQRRLGAGTIVPSFDPFLSLRGYTDHSVTQEANAFQTGVLTFKQTPSGPAPVTPGSMGTGLQINYQGQRFADNSPYKSINPTLNASFAVIVTQQLLAGFGKATNARYIQIAKKNLQITDLAFLWYHGHPGGEHLLRHMVNAYQDEQIKERLLSFAQKTLSDDQGN